ncbi:MAG TPA: SMP-30/gluconolactonase/LRE family protein [Candidatus Polarisedimenticolaceae bacterium]
MRRVVLSVALAALPAAAQVTPDAPVAGNPDAIVDLQSAEGAALVKAQWRFAEGDGADEAILPEALETRRTMGGRAFAWYRTSVTIPEKVGTLSTAGNAVVFEIVVDDYAEIRVDGALPKVLGQTGGALIKGFNAPNRVVLTSDAKPGRTFKLEVFAANGPLAEPPKNRVWVRSATLDFFKSGKLGAFEVVKATVERLDPALDAVVPRDAVFERVARGFQFTEGPVWVKQGGYLLFSDPNANAIYRWAPDGQVSVYRTKSGYAGLDVGEYGQPGSNGLALDAEGRLTIDEHGRRRVVRLEPNGAITVLADRFEGKRLNSPNDLVYRSDGTLYFTDPPFGLPKYHDDPRRELPFYGVFALKDGVLKVVSKDLLGPNGLAFSPDETYLYVANWDPKRKVVMRYEVRPDGGLANGRVFFDMGAAPESEALDGIKVDPRGNLFVSGPGGVWVLSAAGKHLGTIRLPELPANFAFGGDDGRTLFLTARTSVYRVRL